MLQELYKSSLNNRKWQLHYKKKLKSGKVAHLWLFRFPTYSDSGKVITEWRTAFTVRDTDRAARKWVMSTTNEDSGITGDGSIEGLAWAYRKLEEIAAQLPSTSVIVVDAEDDRRWRAYQYLTRKGWFFHDGGLCKWGAA